MWVRGEASWALNTTMTWMETMMLSLARHLADATQGWGLADRHMLSVGSQHADCRNALLVLF